VLAEIRRLLHAGGLLFARAAQRRLAYVEGFIIDLLSFLAVFGLSLLLWQAVRKQGADLPLPWNQFLSYLVLAFAVTFSMELGVNETFSQGVRSGMIAIDLIKPLPLTWLYFCHALSWSALQALYAGIALVCFLPFLQSVPLPADLAHWGAFALSLGLAVLVQFGIVFLFAQGAFITQFGYGIFYMRLMMHQIFCGAFAPVEMFPESLKPWALALPFRQVVDTPVRLALGMAPLSELPGMLLQQLLWAIGLFAVGQLVFSRMLGRVQIQGG
jgi:ABC-2 type transport system permease protein